MHVPSTKPKALLRFLMDATGITVSALARKLRVETAVIHSWIDGSSEPAGEAIDRLQAFARQMESEVPDDKPRVVSPTLPSRLIHGDCLEVLKTLPDASVDLILSDIPYGIGLDDWDVLHANNNSAYLGASDAQTRAGKVFNKRRKPINGWSSADKAMSSEYYDWCRSWTGDWLRVLKPGGSAFLFCGRRFAHRAAAAMEDEGFNLRDTLAWIRPQAVFRAQRLSVVYQKRALLKAAERWEGWRVGNLRPVFEPIVWCFKPYTVTIADNMLDHHLGAMNVAALEQLTGRSDNVLRFGFEKGERGHHEAQKPLALMSALIELVTTPGQIVLDPFAGSGSTALAAKKLGRRYLAVERDECNFNVAKERLDGVLVPPEVP